MGLLNYLMAKRHNMGFNQVKEVYVSKETSYGKISPELIKVVKAKWNSLPKDYDLAKREVKRVRILRLAPSHKFAGTMHREEQVLDIKQCHEHPDLEFYKITVVHELAHAYFNRMHRLDPDKTEKFWDVVIKLKPINYYVATFKHNVWSYVTEYHSALSEIVDASEATQRDILVDEKTKEKAIQAYLEFHGRV